AACLVLPPCRPAVRDPDRPGQRPQLHELGQRLHAAEGLKPACDGLGARLEPQARTAIALHATADGGRQVLESALVTARPPARRTVGSAARLRSTTATGRRSR